MSSSYWKTIATLENEEVRIEFQWLMEDMRDPMSDSTKPQVERNPERNRVSCYDKSRNLPTSQFSVPKDLGNYYYKAMKSNPGILEGLMDQLCLDVCAYHDDFGSYSDIYKDLNNVRPHYTQEQWDSVVARVRNLK